MTDFEPIEHYGVVGNLDTCALVSRTGSVDWCPVPHLESPSVFARTLDRDGGQFSLRPAAEAESRQSYLDRTNVLETTFETDAGTLVCTDFMPVYEIDDERVPVRALYRRVTCPDGRVTVAGRFRPRFDYARAETVVEPARGGLTARRATVDGVASDGSDDTADVPDRLRLSAAVDWTVPPTDDRATCELELSAGDSQWFVLQWDGEDPVDPATARRSLERTREFWRDWAHTCGEGRCVFGGPWHDLVVRSGLVLKLLTHHETGAIAAAATTSLPETIGGVRNWDYRFNWIRDAAFTLQALSNLGHVTEAQEYFEWFLGIAATERPDELQPLYGLHGERDLQERELDHLSGYRDSAPVRIGNEAADQRQLDTYGELVLGIHEMVRAAGSLKDPTWAATRSVVDFVAEVWSEPDAGIWEVRSEPEQFVFSKTMCWAALDRGIDLAETYDRDADLDRWRAERDAVEEAILSRGVRGEPGHFVRSFDAETVDASCLLVPFVGFLPFDDPRVQATIDVIDDRLGIGGGLLRRYEGADGLPGEEGAFLLCSFWLITALALSGRVEAARDRFETVVEYASPLGLFAEEVDPETGRQLGNVPQAFSHVGLINAALYLGTATGRVEPGLEPLGTVVGSHAVSADDD